MVSSKPSKQRLLLIKAPINVKRKLLIAKLSDELISKYGVKRFSVRAGDTVKIVRGDWVGHEGKVVKVDVEGGRIHVEGVTIKKADGTPVYYPVHPSKVVITKLDVSDKWREKIIKRRKGG
ncbi:MAG: 50S ribosomal protein L24 [Sulfolobales archaeon]|nr:50S ribosomal protein L24 [Sulfolobales archaeon]MCX8186389.1 50S ribosomal protein L24 [Sulfolobales archaeon]